MKETICPLKLFMEVTGGRWKPSIICLLEDGESKRFSKIKEFLPDITNTALSQALKDLEENGIISRIQYSEMPVRVEYKITDEGKEVLPILNSINQF